MRTLHPNRMEDVYWRPGIEREGSVSVKSGSRGGLGSREVVEWEELGTMAIHARKAWSGHCPWEPVSSRNDANLEVKTEVLEKKKEAGRCVVLSQ
jgi:hypothetical protein